MHRSLAIVFLLLSAALGPAGCASPGVGDAYPPEPCREYRGVWVATVANIDWPSRPGLGDSELRAEMDRILDTAHRLSLNAVFLQVRPSCDSIYQSSLEPWSEFLVGGGSTPGFDPLAAWIAGAHARGLELHAWFNPFRARAATAKVAAAPEHVSRTHPDLVREVGREQWLDPGDPAAREHSLRVVLDAVRRYHLDGVHFDDYFYPYPAKDTPFPDDQTYARYTGAGGALSRSDWRRDNINAFVRSVSERVHLEKPWVRFGISPFGIWRPENPAGVKGLDAYEALNADARRWLAEGWVDYLAPQLYWKIDSPQPYPKLLDWWLGRSRETSGRPILVGTFTSKVGDVPDGSRVWGVEEILNQITLARARFGAGGSIHFSAAPLVRNRAGIADALARGAYAEPALPPEMPWLAVGPRPGPPQVDIPADSDETMVVRWSGGVNGPGLHRWLVWTRCAGVWTMRIIPADARDRESHVALPRRSAAGDLDRVAVAQVDAAGRVGSLAVVRVPDRLASTPQAATVSP